MRIEAYQKVRLFANYYAFPIQSGSSTDKTSRPGNWWDLGPGEVNIILSTIILVIIDCIRADSEGVMGKFYGQIIGPKCCKCLVDI